jgi:hypothetical protein
MSFVQIEGTRMDRAWCYRVIFFTILPRSDPSVCLDPVLLKILELTGPDQTVLEFILGPW